MNLAKIVGTLAISASALTAPALTASGDTYTQHCTRIGGVHIHTERAVCTSHDACGCPKTSVYKTTSVFRNPEEGIPRKVGCLINKVGEGIEKAAKNVEKSVKNAFDKKKCNPCKSYNMCEPIYAPACDCINRPAVREPTVIGPTLAPVPEVQYKQK